MAADDAMVSPTRMADTENKIIEARPKTLFLAGAVCSDMLVSFPET
jgi:hypothetical protein